MSEKPELSVNSAVILGQKCISGWVFFLAYFLEIQDIILGAAIFVLPGVSVTGQ